MLNVMIALPLEINEFEAKDMKLYFKDIINET